MRPVLAILVATALLVPAAADWPQFHRDERNRGLGDDTYRPYNAVWWTADPGVGRIEASPVAAEGLLVVAGSNGKVVAMDASTGKAKWNHTMSRGVLGAPAIDNGRVYVVDEGGTLKALDLQTGFVHRTATVGATMGGVSVHEGSVYVGNEAGSMFRFEAHSLTQAWKFDTGSIYTNNTCGTTSKVPAGAVRGTPAVYKGKVIFGSFNNYVYAVSEFGQGELQWVYKTNDLVLSSPVVDQDRDRVLVGSYDRTVTALRASPSVSEPAPCKGGYSIENHDVKPDWTFTVPSDVGNSAVRATPAIAGTTVVVGALNGHVYALSAVTGKQLWSHNTGAAIMGSPAAANGTVVVPNDAGRLVWLHLGNGTEIKRHESEAPLKASPALVQDRTYVATFPGKVSLLGAGIPKRPDLTVDMPRLNGTEIAVTVRNTGDGAAEPTILRLHLDGEFLIDVNITALGPSDAFDLRHLLDIGPPYTVRATIDPMNAVAETDEDDNMQERRFEAEPPPTTSSTPTPDPTTNPPSDPTPAPAPTTAPPEGLPGAGLVLVAGLLAAVAVLWRRSLDG